MARHSTGVQPPVFIVDDDAVLLGALDGLLTSHGWAVRGFGSIEAFLHGVAPADPGLLLLDVELPESNGLALQSRLAQQGDFRPIIFMTGHEQVSTAVDAMKGGAIEFLIKPFREEALLSAVDQAAAREETRLDALEERGDLEARVGALTLREKQVMQQVVSGRLNKQIANDLAIAEITVKIHRSSMMHKMKAGSVAALVRLHDRLFPTDR